MTIKEILACEIPEEHYKALAILKAYIENMYHIGTYKRKDSDSLCASFSALYEIANGRFEHENLQGWTIGKKQMLSEVLAVMDEMIRDESGLQDHIGLTYSECGEYDRDTLDELIRQLGFAMQPGTKKRGNG